MHFNISSGRFTRLRTNYRWLLPILSVLLVLCLSTIYFRRIFTHSSAVDLFPSHQPFFLGGHAIGDLPTTRFDADRDTESLKALCENTTWTDGLWLQCHSYCGPNETSVCGGLNNARNRIQTCLRLAVDAGAGLILPTMTTRNEDNLRNTNAGVGCPDMFLDVGYLQEAIRESCPQLNLRYCGDTSGIQTTLQTTRRVFDSPPHFIGTFRDLIDSTLSNATSATNISSLRPVAVEYGDSYIGWSYAESGEGKDIQEGLFKIVRFNPKLLALGTKILDSPQLREGFVGIHLRGEDDWPAQFGTAEEQMRLYAAEIQNIEDMKTIYVSCGDRDVIEKFREQASALGYTVHDKWTLLSNQAALLSQINGLLFDEKAILEYQILINAAYFMGVLTSSMSVMVAYTRSIEAENDFFTSHIFPESKREGARRVYVGAPLLKGGEYTKLMVMDSLDIMSAFP